MAAIRTVVGFELQTLTANVEIVSVVGSPAIETTIKRSGAASLKTQASGSEVSVKIDNDPGAAESFIRQVAIYVPTGGLPASLTKIIQLSDAGGDHTSIRINSDGTLELWDDVAAAQIGSDSPAITLDSFENIIELDVGTFNMGNDVIAKLNKKIFAQAATHSAGATHRFMEVGVMGSVTSTIYFDDIIVLEATSGTDITRWIGGIKLVLSNPNAAGDNAATAGLYSAIDDVDDADYIEIDGTETPTYNMQSSSDIGLPSDALVQFVAVGARVRGETSTSCSWLPRIKSQASGTVVTGTTTTIASASFNSHDDTATARVYKLVSHTDPQAGGSWTPALIDTMQIGASAPDPAPDVWISSMWAYIGYLEKTSTIIFRDEFAVASNTDLQSKTPNVGTSWTRLWGTTAGTDTLAMAATDRASPEAGADSGVMYTANGTYPGADYEVEFEMSILDIATTTPQYIFVRVQDQENMYAVRIIDQAGSNTCQLYKKVSGTWTALGSAFSPPADGAICKLQIIGSALKFFIDGVEVASATDTAITATGKAGIGFGGGAELVTSTDDMDVDNDIDNFTVYNLITSVDTSSERSAKIHGTATTNSERSAKTTGQATSNSERSATLIGQALTTDERLAKTIGTFTTNSERDSKTTGQVLTNDQRDAKLIGTADANSERNSKITGELTSNDERASKLTGQALVNSERDSKLIGTATANSERDSKITGKESASSERDSKLTGNATANSERSAKITGTATDSSEKNAILTGTLTDSSERPAKTIGTATASSERDAKITGNATANSERDSKITGTATSNDERSAKLVGQDTANSERSGKLTGTAEIQVNDEKDAKLTGQALANSEREGKLTGTATANNERSVKTTGQLTDSSERASKLIGQALASAERNSKLIGTATSNDERSAKATGQDTSNSERSANLKGGVNVNDERSAKLIGTATDNSERNAKTTGTLTTASERDSKLIGQALALSERDGKIIGTDTANSQRDSKLTGQDTSSSERAGKLVGQDTSNAERSAVLIGSVPDERAVKIYAGYTFTISDNFDTTDNKDEVNTTAKWEGDGQITLN